MNENMKKQLELLNQQLKDLTAIYCRESARFGISENEFWVWYALLVLGGEYSQQDICDMWSVPKQTVNSVITNMKKKDYVYLETVPGTRNRKIIRLTDTGREFGEHVVIQIYKAEQRTFERLSEQERQACIALLGKYITVLQEETNGI